MIQDEKQIQLKNRLNYDFTVICDFCESLYTKRLSESHSNLYRNKRFHFCSLKCVRSSLSKGKIRDAIASSLSYPTFDRQCDVCNIIKTIKSYDLSPDGFYFCSKKCVYKAQKHSGITYERKKSKCIEKYGVNFSMAREDIKELRRQNNNIKYSVDSVFQLETTKIKIKQTMKERYDVESYSQTEDWKEKSIKTSIKKYGFKSPIENPDIIEKRKLTMIERWGGPSTWESPELKKRYEETMLDRYGDILIARVPTFISSSMDKKMIASCGKTWSQYIEDLPEFNKFRRIVDKITRQQPIELLKDYDKRGEYHLDHKFSVAEGYRQEIDAKIIGNIVNLEFIPGKENMSKGDSCSINKNVLLDEYRKVNND